MRIKLNFTITIALVIVSCALTYIINEYIHNRINKITNNTIEEISGASSEINSDLVIDPIKKFRFIKPLIEPEPIKESVSFSRLKIKINSYIEGLKKAHKLVSASVYLRYFGHGSRMNINPEETYTPGSMFKVVNLLLYLKLNEQDPSLLEKKLFNNLPQEAIRTQTYNSKQIEDNKIYTVKELLEYMIVYSDNKATTLLMANIDNKLYLKMVSDLGIPIPKTSDNLLILTTSQYASLFKLLYNSSYLLHENSEYALSLLNQSDFKMGLLNGLPENIKVAHKFGESGTKEQPELHECGLIYVDYEPYLITVMTKGYNIHDLPPVLSTISKMVYDDISQKEE